MSCWDRGMSGRQGHARGENISRKSKRKTKTVGMITTKHWCILLLSYCNILFLYVTPTPISHFLSLSVPSFHFIQNTVSTSVHSKLQTAQTHCICLLGADIIWKCHCAGVGPFSGSVVRGCIQLNTTSKGPVFLWSFLFHHKACAEEVCREDQPFPPSHRMMYPNASFWELKPKKPCRSAASSSKWPLPAVELLIGWWQQNRNMFILDNSTLHDLSPMPIFNASAKSTMYWGGKRGCGGWSGG